MRSDEYDRLGLMSIFTVSFFGHRYIDNINRVEDQLETLLRKLLSEHEYCEFLWDVTETSTNAFHRNRKTKRTFRDDNCSPCFGSAIFENDFLDNEQSFGNTTMKLKSANSLPGRISKLRSNCGNRSMVDRSDLVVFNVA
jgi:hypothetical protein